MMKLSTGSWFLYNTENVELLVAKRGGRVVSGSFKQPRENNLYFAETSLQYIFRIRVRPIFSVSKPHANLKVCVCTYMNVSTII